VTPIIEWRVVCRGLEPAYFLGKNARYNAHIYAKHRPHLHPVIWWRETWGNGTGPWFDITNRDPNTTQVATS